MFVYQPTFNMFELKEDKDTEYVVGWKSKRVSASKLTLFYIFGYKTGISSTIPSQDEERCKSLKHL